jgi:hypothetical protein
LNRHGPRLRGASLALLALVALAAFAPVTPARGAEFGIVPGSFKVQLLDSEGNPENIAGSHPDLHISFALNVAGTGTTPRDFVFELPPGLASSPSAVPVCPRVVYETPEGCPPESQIGVVKLRFASSGETTLPTFALEPEGDEAFSVGSKSTLKSFTPELRPSDFGVTLRSSDLAKVELTEGQFELWGIPADHQSGTGIDRRPLLSAPTRCGLAEFTFRTRSWEEDAAWMSETTDTGGPLEGCETLSFAPRLEMKLGNPVADSPTSLRLDLTARDESGPDERADANIENVDIALPDGLTIAPGAAQGLTACGDAQFDSGSTTPPQCPPSSKVGTTEFESPALGRPLAGSVYLGESRPGQRMRLLIALSALDGTAKFTSAMRVDALTGRLTTSLVGLPQLAFHRITLQLGEGADSLLASPLGCGPATASAKFDPYGGGASIHSVASVAIAPRFAGALCPGPIPFAPTLTASSTPNRAGRPAAFSATLTRRDGELMPRRFAMKLPAGLSPGLGGVQACEGAELAADACPGTSRIGAIVASAGSGPSSALLSGDVYVTGPYRRSPFGLLMRLRAVLGPFDLGTMSVRAAADVDSDGRATVTTDAFPAAIEGIPVRFRSIELRMDRPGLLRNPTSCRQESIDATIEASSGTWAAAQSPFKVRGCRRLPFKPRFRISLRQDGSNRDGVVVEVATRLRGGDANLRSLQMSLPPELGFRAAALRQICSRPDASAGECPPGARIGSATAFTPLSKSGLRGGIYVVRPKGNGLPDLWAIVSAQGVRLALRGTAASRHGQVVSSFSGLPDVLLSRMRLKLGSDRSSALFLKGGACRDGTPRRLTSTLSASAQNGLRRRMEVPLEVRADCSRSRPNR